MSERDLFMAALQIDDAAQRSAYLDRACGADADLRARVAALLAAFAQAGSFLQQPAAEPAATLDAPPPGAAAPAGAGIAPGLQIGPYKLLEQIGEGGFGVVFLAEQHEPVRRKVALKVLKPGMDTRQVVVRFEAERQALAIMDHPNIAKVFDGGATPSGRPYFVMELVKGTPITEFCDQHQLTPRERLALFVPVCQAVQHAHQKGIIHRDLKPSNVLVSRHDTTPVVKVIDFGVAKALGQELTDKTLYTGIAQMIGTPLYMSPEQAGMSDLDVDTRSDIYSLGVLLYELLTGTTPFAKERFKTAAYDEIRRIIRDEEPPRPSTRLSESKESLRSISAQRQTEPAKLRKLVRGELDWIVMKALEKDRSRRYETANSFAMDLQRYLADEPVQACPPSAWYRTCKFTRRNKRILAASAVVALALTIGTIVSGWQAIRATEAEGLAQERLQAETEARGATQAQLLLTQEARNATQEQLRLTQQAEEKAKGRLYRSLVAQARGSRLSRRIGQRFETLKTLAEATRMARAMNLPEANLLELRNEVIACLALPDMRIAKEWDGCPEGTWRVAFADTRERYARVDRNGTVSVRRIADDAELHHLDGFGTGASDVIFSPDGKFLGHFSGPRFRLWNLSAKEPVRLLEGELDTFAFSPDSRQFARALPDGSLRLYDLPSGEEIKQLKAGPRALGGMAFHPKERQLAICHAGGIQIRNFETDEIVTELEQRGQFHGPRLAWHPDGKTLAVVGDDRTIHLWDVVSRQVVARLEGHKNAGIECAFNHAGDLLASSGWDGTLRLWDPRTGQQLFQTRMWVHRPHFSRNDHLPAVGGDNKLMLWEVAAAPCFRTLARGLLLGKDEYFSSAIHPDGRLLALGMRNEVGLWDVGTGKFVGAIPSGPGISHVLFEPSGALLTNSRGGLFRWLVNVDPNSAERLRIGPPEKLPLPGSDCAVACSRDGRVLASAQYDGGVVLHADRPGEPVPLKPHGDVRYIAVSPDGRLVATASHSGTQVKVWNALNGQLEKVLDGAWWVRFSPDGKWLASGGCRLWSIDGWKPAAVISGGAFAFSPDSKSLAVETGQGVVRLVHVESGREYARLEDPNQDRVSDSMTFTPDGGELVTTSNDSSMIRIWDLRAIQEELAKMGLNLQLPPFPRARPVARQPLQVQVEGGDRAKASPDRPEIDQPFLAQKRRAVEANPNSSLACNNLAWAYLTAPAPLRDVKAAVPLAEKAVRLEPSATYRNTLALAYYRAGRYREAVRILESNLHDQPDWLLAYDLYFLAMCHHQLTDGPRARQFLALADRWSASHRQELTPHVGELTTFRAEANELLGAGKKKD